MSEAKLQEQINQLIINCENWEVNYHQARMQAIEMRRTVAALEERNKELMVKLKALEKENETKKAKED